MRSMAVATSGRQGKSIWDPIGDTLLLDRSIVGRVEESDLEAEHSAEEVLPLAV